MSHIPVVKKLFWLWLLVSIGIWQISFASAFTTAWHPRSAAQSTFRLSLSTDPRANEHNGAFTIVHVDNVRRNSNVPWTLEGLMESATKWRNTLHPSTCLSLVVDNHGSSIPLLYTGGPLDDKVGVFFSGNTSKTNDEIISLIQECNSKQATVVTADEDLKQKCLQVAGKSTRLEFIEPVAFLRQIESLSDKTYSLRLTESQTTANIDNKDCVEESCRDLFRQTVTLREELEMLNRLLNPKGTRPNGKKKQISKKQRSKLVGKRDRARERLESLTFEVESASDTSRRNGATQSITQKKDSVYPTESTHERQLLAEQLRCRLDRAGTISFSFGTDEDSPNIHDILWNAKSGILNTINGKTQRDSVDQSTNRDGRSLSTSVLKVPCRFNRNESNDNVPSTLLRIVTISDTHGYEHELFAHTTQGDTPYLLPSADMLLHCGDFTESGSRKVKMQAKARLDAFFAAQTHIPTKIVLRGNHDPHIPSRVLFPRSKAMYVTRPTTMTLQHNITLELRPFSRRGTTPLLPPCDILASHEPPFGILDLTYHRLRAGSMVLRRAVESSDDKPSIWLCGHIHEGRGSVLHTFVDKHTEASSASTLVVNAANANTGRANRLVTGPVVVDIVRDGRDAETTVD